VVCVQYDGALPHLFCFPRVLRALVWRKPQLQEIAGAISDANTDGDDGHACKLIYSNTSISCDCLFLTRTQSATTSDEVSDDRTMSRDELGRERIAFTGVEAVESGCELLLQMLGRGR
jgi:hypothetical protein